MSRKTLKIIACILIGFILNGCVVKRLLEFKHQLKTPEKYIHFETKGVLVLKKPLLQLEDIALLSGVYPSKIEN